MSGTSEESIASADIGDRLSGPRVGVVTGRGEFKARADSEGNYLYSPGSPKFNQVQSFFRSMPIDASTGLSTAMS